MTNNKFYYISSGAKNAMRTLRQVVSVPGVYFRDGYICNLARDFDQAMQKARARVGADATVEGSDFDLNKWGEKVFGQSIKPWMKQQIEQIELGYMPFGKHKGEKIEDLPVGYVKYWVEQVASNTVGQVLVQKFTDIANERGYFDLWEKEEKEKEEKKLAEIANMEYVGYVGERKVVFVKCVKSLCFHNYTYAINICRDRHGNELVYKGSNKWEEGDFYKVRVTIKEHKEYKGKPQTLIKRPHIIKVVKNEETEKA